MNRKSVILNANNFTYPTKSERSKAIDRFPQIESFQFKKSDSIKSFLIANLTAKETSRQSHLFWWNHSLNNRLAKLKETYIYALTNLKRGFPDGAPITETEAISKIQFDYYSEIFFYFFFSTRDMLGQLLRIYFDLNITEESLKFNITFLDKIKSKDQYTGELLNIFYTDTKKASVFRNCFAHRFSPNETDYRPTYTNDNGHEILEAGNGNSLSSIEIMDVMDDSLFQLKKLMEGLVNRIK